MAKKKPQKRSVLPIFIFLAIIAFIICAFRYPSLILYEEINIAEPEPWCVKGEVWESDDTLPLIIVGVVMEGEHQGLCHVRYGVEDDHPLSNFDLYLDHKGSGIAVNRALGESFPVIK